MIDRKKIRNTIDDIFDNYNNSGDVLADYEAAVRAVVAMNEHSNRIGFNEGINTAISIIGQCIPYDPTLKKLIAALEGIKSE